MRQVSSAILAGIIVLTSDITHGVLGVIDGACSVIGDALGAIDLTSDTNDGPQGISDDGWSAIGKEKSATGYAQSVGDDTQDIIDDVICIIFWARDVVSG